MTSRICLRDLTSEITQPLSPSSAGHKRVSPTQPPGRRHRPLSPEEGQAVAAPVADRSGGGEGFGSEESQVPTRFCSSATYVPEIHLPPASSLICQTETVL